MSRTTLCVLTASALAVVSLTCMVTRYLVLGAEVKVPAGPDTWKVTLLVQGKTAGPVRLIQTAPLDFGHQHVLSESFRSDELVHKTSEDRHPDQRQVLWSPLPSFNGGAFRARYEMYCQVDVKEPSPSMTELAKKLYAAPEAGDQLQSDAGIERDHPSIAALARHQTTGLDRPFDQVESLFNYVADEVANEPTIPGPARGALDCLFNGSGDAGAKSRLLVALCRNRGIPARLVTGLALTKGPEQTAHVWVEAWLRDQWLPMCPFYHHFGKMPRSFLVFGFGDQLPIRGRNTKSLNYAFMVLRQPATEPEAQARAGWLKSSLTTLSFHALPPAEQRLVEFLLLLPIAALIICVYRNVIGLHSFGTFAPALLGLAFRDLRSLPGILVFVAILLIGWSMRRLLDRYHLLQVPRIAFLLSLVVITLIAAVVLTNYWNWPTTRYITLFPMVILTNMIERFWTLETEDGTAASFRTLVYTVLISGTISVVLSFHAVPRHMFRYPETLGVIMACQLLIGRYTGYRLSELYRFRDFLGMRSALGATQDRPTRKAA